MKVYCASCGYGFNSVNIPYNLPFLIQPPKCDGESKGVITMMNPPVGYTINSETGAISGICLSPENTEVKSTIQITGLAVTLEITFNVVGYDSFASGISTYYAASSDEAMLDPKVDDIYGGKVEVKGQLLSTATISCGTASSACPFGLTGNGLYFYMYGAFKVETAGKYSFKVDAFDHGVVYIDSLTEKNPTELNVQPYILEKDLTVGVHFIAVLVWNENEGGGVTISYHKPSDDADVYNVFTSNNIKSLPLPLQFVEWKSTSLILTVGQSQTLTPTITGYAYNFDSSPNLPSGMSFDYRGQINGIPKIVSDKETFTINAYSWDNTQVIRTTLDIQVIDKTVESMKIGLDSYYYSSPSRGCEFSLIDESIDILKFRRIDTIINRMSDVNAWSGLSGDFINQYIVKWEGSLYVPMNGNYRITVNVNGGFKLIIGDTELIETSQCGLNTVTNIIDLKTGLVSITMYYWKSSGDTIKSISLQWETTDGSMRLTQIPDSYFYHNPRYQFTYDYVIASYIKGIAIVRNCPIFSEIDQSKYGNYQPNPTLPGGLSIDGSGCITGTINDVAESSEMKSYEISITNLEDPTSDPIKVSIQIAFDTYTIPTSIVYPAMTFSIGVFGSYKPTSVVGDHYTIQVSEKSLPIGLAINSATGEISGIPTESVVAPDNTFKILVTNAMGSYSGSATITVNDCPNNGYFYQFNFITGSGGNYLSLVSLMAGGEVVYYNTTHASDTYYTIKGCSNGPQLSISIQQSSGRVGTYSVYGKGKNLFKYGRWNQGSTAVTVSLDTITSVPSISYGQTTLTLISQETVSILPDILSGAVTSFELNANTILPDGLYLNSSNGEIYGTVGKVSEIQRGTFQIIGKNGDDKVSSPIQMTYTINTGCQNNQILLAITVYGGLTGQYMYITVNSPNGVEIFGQNGIGNGKTKYYSMCSDAGYYSVKYGSTNKGAWDSSTFAVIANRDTTIKTIKFSGGLEKTDQFSLSVEIPSTAQWEYSSVFVEGWNTNPVISPQWQMSTPGLFVRPTTTTYYRKVLNVNTLTGLVSFSMRITFDYGIVGYVNGKEFYRKNIPADDTPNVNLYANKKNEKGEYSIVGSISLFNVGQNVVAFETHKISGENPQTDPFQVRMSFVGAEEGCKAMYSGIYANPPDVVVVDDTAPSGTDMDGPEGLKKMFDVNHDTKYMTHAEDKDWPNIYIRLVNPSSFSVYTMVTAFDCWQRDPSKWIIYGSKDYDENDETNVRWIQLDNRDDYNLLPNDRKFPVQFNIDEQYKDLIFEGIQIKIRNYKDWKAEECNWKTNYVQLADFYPTICGAKMCPSNYPFSPTVAGGYGTYPCSVDSITNIKMLCNNDGTWSNQYDLTECDAGLLTYPNSVTVTMNENVNIEPTVTGTIIDVTAVDPLPAGLNVNILTGVITGVPTKASETKQYILQYYSKNSFQNAVININVLTPSCLSFDGSKNISINEMETVRCDATHSGYRSRFCYATIPPKWGEWDVSGCTLGPSPACDYPQSEYMLTLNQKANDIVPVCKSIVVTSSIDPALPSGMMFDPTTGKISGTPTSPLRRSAYNIRFEGTNNGYDNQQLYLTVWGKITTCSYIYSGDINLFLNNKFTLDAPICDHTVQTFTANALPAGLSMSLDGVISGQPSGISQTLVTITASNPVGQYTFNIKINVLAEPATPHLLGKFTKEVYTSMSDWQTVWNGLEDGSIEHDTADSPDGLSKWFRYADNCIYGTNVKRSRHYYAKYTGSLDISVAGDWVFQINSDDRLYFFLDDMTKPIIETDVIGQFYTFTIKSLTPGKHALGLLFYQGDFDQFINMLWKAPYATDFESIPDSAMTQSPAFLSKFAYPASDLIFMAGVPITKIEPDLVGSYTKITLNTALPEGISFRNGIIEGNPKYEFPRTRITVKCESLTTTIEATLYITVISLQKENLLSGLSGEYYTYSGEIGCSYVDPRSDSSYILTYSRIIPTYYHPPSTEVWTGLTGAFAAQFVARWEGYLNVPENGYYDFTIKAEDGLRFTIADQNIETTECGLNTVKSTLNLKSGLNSIVITYWKAQSSVETSVSIRWRKRTGQIISEQELPNSRLYHKPSSIFSYTYIQAVYIVNIPIIENPPIFFSVNPNTYTTFYVEPPLPLGIDINTATGVISGTPKKAVTSSYYKVTTLSTDGSIFSYSLLIGVDPYNPPIDLKYENITGRIGTAITSTKPTVGNAENVRYSTSDTLPFGLSIDQLTGTISGTPEQAFNKIITVKCSNPSGSISTIVLIKINGCSSGKSYVKLMYSINNKDVTLSLTDKNGEKLVDKNSESLKEFTSESYAECIDSGSTTLSIQSTAKLGGKYSVYLEGELLKIGNYNDKQDYVNYVFDTSIVTTKPTITEYLLSTPLYYGVSYSYYPTLTGGATKFAIDSSITLPSTMTFNTVTGVLTGIAYDSITLPIIASNRDGNSSDSYSLQITPTACQGSIVNIRVVTSTDGQLITLSVKNQLNTALIEFSSLPNNMDKTYSFCENSGTLQIAVGSTSNIKWLDGSYVEVSVFNLPVTKFSLQEDSNSKNYVFKFNSLVTSSNSWQITNAATTSGWNNLYPVVPPTGWSSYTYGLFPSRLEPTTYYRTQFTLTDAIITVSRLQLNVQFDAGIICYLNGNEFYRRNLPTTGVTHYYSANAIFNPPIQMTINIGSHLLQRGTNILAIETHKHSDSLVTDPLRVSLTSINDLIEECQIRTLSSLENPTMTVTSTIDSPSSSQTIDRSYDFNVETKFVSTTVNDNTFPVDLVYKWPSGRAEFINVVKLTTADDNPNNDPIEFVLYGSYNRDKLEWYKIQEFKNGDMTQERKADVSFNVGENYKSFEAYRIQIRSIRSIQSVGEITPAIQFAELVVSNCKPKYCVSEGDWKDTVAGTVAYLTCPTGTYGYQERSCLNIMNTASWGDIVNNCKTKANTINYGINNEINFYVGQYGNFTPTIDGGVDNYTIDCVLPNGITFNIRYGWILGEATSISTNASCTVTGNVGESTIQTTVQITIIQLKCLSDGVYDDTLAGEYAAQPCGNGYSGLKTKYCDGSTVPAQWGMVDMSSCVLLKPEIRFGSSDYTFNLNDQVQLIPLLEAAEFTCSGSNLPGGLSVIPSTCAISGITNSPVSDSQVGVFVTNSVGTTTVYITITVLTTTAVIMYTPSSFIFYVGFINSSPPPTILSGGTVQFSEIYPAAPKGLSLQNTGIISGTVAAGVPESLNTYVVRGNQNGVMVQSNPVTIQVIQPKCQFLSEDFPETNAGETVTAPCPEGFTGSISRKCSNDIAPSWGNVINTCKTDVPMCQTDGVFPSTRPDFVASVSCGEGQLGNKTRECKWNNKGIPEWGDINYDECLNVNPAINYPSTDIVIIINRQLDTKPELVQVNPPLTIAPSILPCSFTFNSQDGSISGTCASTQPKQTFVVSGKGIDGKDYSTTITITVSYNYATHFSYENPAMTFYIGIEESSYNEPTKDGYIESFSINPALPNYLLINRESGKIYGTVAKSVTPSTAQYAVTGIVNLMLTTAITITIVQPKCPSETVDLITWPETNAGKMVTIECPTGYEGSQQRVCGNTKDPEWGQVTGICSAAVPTFKYPSSFYSFITGTQITPITPTNIENSPTSWEVDCSVPLEGITFSTANGVFSGMTTKTFISTCTVTATNTMGTSQPFELTIMITNSYATAIKYEQSEMTFYVGILENSYPAPTIDGVITRISISPSLPYGLFINSQDGQIYGTVANGASEQQLVEYRVNGLAGANTISTTVRITVIQPKCVEVVEDGIIWPTTSGGSTVALACPNDDTITIQRMCISGKEALWGQVIGSCGSLIPSFTYPSSFYKFITGKQIDVISPQDIKNSPTSWNSECSVQLQGITFSKSTGEFSGSPSTSFTSTCKVTASNSKGTSLPVEITLMITSSYATTISYENTDMRFYIGVFENSYKGATVNGDVISFSVDPTLPQGLYINEQDGKIYGSVDEGTPEQTSQPYTVYANVGATSISTIIKITVIQPKCFEFVENGMTWPTTNVGKVANLTCPAGQSGSLQRMCSAGKNPTWGEVIGSCAKNVPEFSYSSSFYSYVAGTSVNIVPQNVKNSPTSWTSNCDVQLQGITFSATTGSFTGTTSSTYTATCKVVAKNAQGSSDTVSVTIMIKTKYATSLSYTTSSITAYVGIDDSIELLPTKDGKITLYSINPSLPTGITIDPKTGKISGSVVKGVPEQSQSYTVYGAVDENSVSTQITITVIQPKCQLTQSGVLTWPETKAGETAVITCPTGYEGNAQRKCSEGRSPVWETEVNNCKAKLPSFNYPQSA